MNNTEQINLEQIQITTSNKVNKINQNNELNKKCCGMKKKYFFWILKFILLLFTLFIIPFFIFKKRGCGENCIDPCIDCCYDYFGNSYNSYFYPKCDFDSCNPKI